MKKIRVLLLMGGGGSEHQVSLASGKEVLNNFDLEKYEVISVVVENQQIDVEQIREINPDVVFIVIHGTVGEDGTIQRILERSNIKFIGCGSEVSAIGMDKTKFKELMVKNGLSVANGIEINKNEKIDFDLIKSLGEKLVVKPVNQGSSVGVSIVDNLENINKAIEEAFKYDNRVLIEEFIDGIEVSCGLIGNEKPISLPVIEICPKEGFFDYEAKYTDGKCEEIVPARLSEEVTRKVQDLALEVFDLMKCKDMARVDFIIKNNNPIILEINTIPGLTPNSLLPKEAKAAGISYSKLLDLLVEMGIN